MANLAHVMTAALLFSRVFCRFRPDTGHISRAVTAIISLVDQGPLEKGLVPRSLAL